ncbi:MAG: hypothetical protein DLM69_06855 [Candidatus Chloroheliales bacterium]|nr:MAG: hypothetical protein DLM69_06855 [Chloroflexota bacterium]
MITTAHPLIRRAAIIALLGFALVLTLSLSSAYAQPRNSVEIINALNKNGYYLSPNAAGLLSSINQKQSDVENKLKDAVNRLKGRGYDAKIAIISTEDIPIQCGSVQCGDARGYTTYLHDYLNMGNGLLVITDLRGSIGAKTAKLSDTEVSNILNSQKAALTSNIVDGTIAYATAIMDKITGNDTSQRNTFITVAVVVVIAILVIAFLTISGLNARWAMRVSSAKKLSSDLSAQVVQMGGNMDFLKMQSQQAYDQVAAHLNPGNQLLSEANDQLAKLKSPGFLPLAFQYTRLDHDLHDVEAALQSAKGEIDQAQQIFNANWSSPNAKVSQPSA